MATYLAQHVVTFFTLIEADDQKSAQDKAKALAFDSEAWGVSDEEMTVEEDNGTDF
jgi:hypothetical protein